MRNTPSGVPCRQAARLQTEKALPVPGAHRQDLTVFRSELFPGVGHEQEQEREQLQTAGQHIEGQHQCGKV